MPQASITFWKCYFNFNRGYSLAATRPFSKTGLTPVRTDIWLVEKGVMSYIGPIRETVKFLCLFVLESNITQVCPNWLFIYLHHIIVQSKILIESERYMLQWNFGHSVHIPGEIFPCSCIVSNWISLYWTLAIFPCRHLCLENMN